MRVRISKRWIKNCWKVPPKSDFSQKTSFGYLNLENTSEDFIFFRIDEDGK